MNRFHRYFLSALILISAGPVFAEGPVPAAPQRLVVVSDDNYPPYIFRGPDGVVEGIVVDQWKLFEKKTGIQVELKAMDWGSALRYIRDGRADVIDTIFYNEERAKVFNFTRPYATLEVPVFFHKNISGITDIESLSGYTIGVKADDACIGVFKNYGITSLQIFKSYEDIIAAAGAGKIKVFCVDKPPALYYLYKMNLENEFRYSLNLYSGQFHRAVKKENSYVLSVVEKGFSEISKDELDAIDNKWIGSSLGSVINLQYLIFAGIAVLVILLNLVYLNLALRKKVKRSTADLHTIIEELRVSEEQKKAFIAAIPDLILVVGCDGTFLNYNSPSPDLLALKPSDFVGKKIIELPFDDDFKKRSLELIGQTSSDGKIRNLIYELKIPSGERRTFEGRIVPYDKQSVLWICRDITDSLRKDEQLLQAQKMETIGNLAGGLSHDFNNVLGGIIGTTSLLKYGISSGNADMESIVRDINTIEDIAKRGADIVTQLLSVTRKRDLAFELVDLNQSIEQVAKICRNTFDKSVELRIVPADFSAYVKADRAQMEQVILNLCVNGYHSMTIMRDKSERLGGILDIRIEKLELNSPFYAIHPEAEGRDFISVIVSDSGVGMNDDIQKKIFDPFFSTKEKIKGTGLGLTMVFNIVQQHKGFIDVFSAPGHGSSFRVSFPSAEFADSAGAAVTEEIITRGSGLVLIIDDEDIIRETASRILEYCGYSTISAPDGEKGIDVYRDNADAVKCVILDLSMPRMSGRDAFIELKRINGGVKVLLASGFREDPRVQECIDLGVSDFIQKPYTMSELASKIHQVLKAK